MCGGNCVEEIIPKLSAACYAVRSTVRIGNSDTLRSIYYAYFYSIIKYGIISGGKFQQWEDFHFTKENGQNYGWCTTQNLLVKSIEAIRDSASSMPVHAFINELYYR
jgi:hypothetical protein